MNDPANSPWERAHQGKQAGELSWYQREATASLGLVEWAGVHVRDRIIDVGGGVSTFVDHLLARGFEDVTVADISASAIAQTQARLAHRAQAVHWITGDVLTCDLAGPYDFWHDRAVFHFLIEAEQRHRYVAQLEQNLRPGGYAMFATFTDMGSKLGPDQCSGFPVQRYSAQTLAKQLGENFELCATQYETHITPRGAEQPFVYTLFGYRR
jgi:2-polyprenyl-3-methyl-5-hydroxy-6-metoxy-1,4-benzoquinol methylase